MSNNIAIANQTVVLVVDDSATTRSVIEKHLVTGYKTLHATNGEEAWEIIESNKEIALIFADMHMPVMNGMALLKQIRESDDTHIASLPVIMITAHKDSVAAKKASFTMGATDFVSKPFSEIDIISRAKSYSQLNQKIVELEQNLTHDSLTGLFNKKGFYEIAEKSVAGSHRHELELSLLTIQINDISDLSKHHSKTIVNQIIKSIANNLQKSLRKEDAISYNGNGSFFVLLPITRVFKAHILAMRLQTTISKLAFALKSEVIRTTIAIGLTSTLDSNEAVKYDSLLKQANLALEASLQDSNCKVARYDELNLAEVVNEGNVTSISELVCEIQTSGDTSSNNVSFVNLDADTYNGYFAEILAGDFEDVPAEHLASMIQPLQTFLEYAQKQTHLETAALEVCD